ncbi:MAG: DoxX family membrane protein [Tannerellaceae bacterium]|jgi:thiosulfate dehydrogenase [quinone] large subunit|nr:DoxX family membrane protein [Tannerellaceae bacterium]
MNKSAYINYSRRQLIALTLLRILVGWHFLYEGLIKLYTPEWSAKEYLQGSVGICAPFFRSLTETESLMHWVNALNVWGLILVGAGLFAGLFSKPCKLAAMLLLALYYLAYPPFAAFGSHIHAEGSYWIINKNLIELVALIVLYLFPSSSITGLDRFINPFIDKFNFKTYKNKSL